MRHEVDELLAEHAPAGAIRLRDLPGVAELEAIVSRRGYHLDPDGENIDERIDQLSRRLFGITEGETDYWDAHPVAEGTELTPEHWRARQEWEAMFEFLSENYDHDSPIMTFWAFMGWDVWDEEGEDLHIVQWLGRQIVCVARRIHPRARLSLTGTDPLVKADGIAAEIEADRWGAAMAEQAKNFRPSRR